MTLPARYIDDAVQELLSDWAGQDDQFFVESGKATIKRNVGKVKSYLAWVDRAEIRAHRKEFTEAFCAAAHVKLRRLQEGVAVYKHYAKQGDSVMETTDRIYDDVGNWSKALPPKPEKEEETLTCGRCPLHCKHESNKE